MNQRRLRKSSSGVFRPTSKFPVFVAVMVVAMVLAAPVQSVSATATPEPTVVDGAPRPPSAEESGAVDVVGVLDGLSIVLPEPVDALLRPMDPQQQRDYLIDHGLDVTLLDAYSPERPAPLAAEVLRVVAPELARPEVADTADYARSLEDAVLMDFVAQLRSLYSDRLGHLRFETEADGIRTLIVPVTELTDDDRSAIAALVPDGIQTRVEVEPAMASQAELVKQKALTASLLKQRFGPGLGDWSIGIDTETNQVRVRLVRPTTGLAAQTLVGVDAVKEATGSSPMEAKVERSDGVEDAESGNLVTVEVVDSLTRPRADERESAPTRGGEWIRNDSGMVCTTNFLWRDSNRYRIGTAGHCSTIEGTALGRRAWRSFDHATAELMFNGLVGTVTHNGWADGSRADYALLTLSEADTAVSRVTTSATTWRPVTSVVDDATIAGPWTWCQVGFGLRTRQGLDKSCGTIKSADVDLTYTLSDGTQLTVRGVYCTDARGDSGDSGGPVYFEHGDSVWAVGIIQGGASTEETCFTTVNATSARSGYQVVASATS